MEIVKIGNVELTKEEAQEIYSEGKYICSYTGIFQINYSQAQQRFYGQKVIDYKGYAQRGRFYIQSASQINKVLGQKILREEKINENF